MGAIKPAFVADDNDFSAEKVAAIGRFARTEQNLRAQGGIWQGAPATAAQLEFAGVPFSRNPNTAPNAAANAGMFPAILVPKPDGVEVWVIYLASYATYANYVVRAQAWRDAWGYPFEVKGDDGGKNSSGLSRQQAWYYLAAKVPPAKVVELVERDLMPAELGDRYRALANPPPPPKSAADEIAAAQAELDDANRYAEARRLREQAEAIRTGKSAGSTGARGLDAGITYELVPTLNGQPLAVEQAWARGAGSGVVWTLDDSGTLGSRFSGRPGMGPSLYPGRTPQSFGLPAWVLGRDSYGRARVLAASVMQQLFGPNWANG
ncbi:MAG: hypothetical protein U1A78_26650 [Polyangia bacterium]